MSSSGTQTLLQRAVPGVRNSERKATSKIQPRRKSSAFQGAIITEKKKKTISSFLRGFYFSCENKGNYENSILTGFMFSGNS